ncbi:hypothetical protein DFH11DRAFT_1618652 [Phellopilus nigrolimitatus]|nr:hypothetical protein DFH11DRAFT_1618652 [Phellopilus nigrolimitatus]
MTAAPYSTQILSIDRETVESLLETISLFKNDGKIAAEDLWSSSSSYNLKNVDKGAEEQNVDKQILRNLERSRDALFSLFQSADQKIANLRQQVQQTQCYVQKLPNELLTLTFKLVHGTFGAEDIEIALSHVCKRFRTIALNIPTLWTRISDIMCPQWIKTRLSRSKQVGLLVEIRRSKWDEQIDSFMSEVLPLAERWLEFRLFATELDEYDDELNTQLRERYADLELPNLQKLQIYADGLVDDDGDFIEYCFCDIDFYDSWDMPSLRGMETSHHIPFGLHLNQGPLPLTTFHFSFNRDSNFAISDFFGSHGFLEQLPDLQYLSLELGDHHSTFYSYPHSEQNGYTTVLQRLETLELKFHSALAAKEFMTNTMPIVFAPQLTNLSVKVLDTGFTCSVDDLLDWLLYVGNFTSLKTLIIDISTFRRAKSGDAFAKLAVRVPHLQHLSIEAPNFQPPDMTARWPSKRQERLFPPELRSMRLRNCVELDSLFLLDLTEKLRMDNLLAGFELLDISGCSGLKQDEVEMLFPREKVLWDAGDYEKDNLGRYEGWLAVCSKEGGNVSDVESAIMEDVWSNSK